MKSKCIMCEKEYETDNYIKFSVEKDGKRLCVYREMNGVCKDCEKGIHEHGVGEYYRKINKAGEL